MRPAVRFPERLRASLLTLAVAGASAGCPGTRTQASYPPSEVYGVEVSFVGEWLGEVAGVEGILVVQELSKTRYYGRFRADDGSVAYSLDLAPEIQDGSPTNLVKFTWQDGRGDLGAGWLLINREDSALTGSLGRGENHTGGLGDMTFIRLE
jgi:hypothetical protein